jgi:phosphoglycolate phosphatase-like HAD superfamily hydrolase
MKRTGLRLYLATSKRAVFADRILDHLKFAAYFDGIYGSVPSGKLDHKPELLAHILAKHGLFPSHSLMVGDRRHDIAGAAVGTVLACSGVMAAGRAERRCRPSGGLPGDLARIPRWSMEEFPDWAAVFKQAVC